MTVFRKFLDFRSQNFLFWPKELSLFSATSSSSETIIVRLNNLKNNFFVKLKKQITFVTFK